MMPAKKGLQRLTIDITKEDHHNLKVMSAVLGKSMHSVIVKSIKGQLKDFKGMEKIEKLKAQNVLE